MPVHKVEGGYKWGQHGKVYPTREQAEKQARAIYANGYTGDTSISGDFVYTESVQKDSDFGRLEITKFNISKEAINEYRGRELAQCEELGLIPDKIYRLYRPADELIKAADSANQVPITIEHPIGLDTPVTPQDRSGATGSDTRFEAPYLVTSGKIWEAEAIRGIKDRSRREVSIFSTFDVEMQPGIFKGEKYDGIIRNICINSVALTMAGRAGYDVAVGDSTTKVTLMDNIKDLIRSRFAAASDSEIDEVHNEIMKLIKSNESEHQTIENDLDTIKKATGDKDANCLGADYKPTGDSKKEEKEVDEEKKATGDTDDDTEKKEKKEEKKATGDSDIQAIIAREVAKVKAQMHAREEAQDLVRARYGKVVGDSAEDIYKSVLKAENVDTTDLHPSAYKALVTHVLATKAQAITHRAVGDSKPLSLDDFEL